MPIAIEIYLCYNILVRDLIIIYRSIYLEVYLNGKMLYLR